MSRNKETDKQTDLVLEVTPTDVGHLKAAVKVCCCKASLKLNFDPHKFTKEAWMRTKEKKETHLKKISYPRFSSARQKQLQSEWL